MSAAQRLARRPEFAQNITHSGGCCRNGIPLLPTADAAAGSNIQIDFLEKCTLRLIIIVGVTYMFVGTSRGRNEIEQSVAWEW